MATVLDDLFGFLLYVVGNLAVTRSLQVDYYSPVILGTEYQLAAELIGREGRTLYMAAAICDETRIVAKAEAAFVIVSIEHFSAAFNAGVVQ